MAVYIFIIIQGKQFILGKDAAKMEELKRSAPSLNFVLILIQLKCKAYFWDYI